MIGMTVCTECGIPYEADESGTDAVGRCEECRDAGKEYRMEHLPQTLDHYRLPTDDAQLVAVWEQVLLHGDLSQLAPADRVRYYADQCRAVGLHPATRPFDLIPSEAGGLTLYVNARGCEQLRSLYSVTLRILRQEYVQDVYTVTVEASVPSGRTEQAEGAVAMVKPAGTWKTAASGKRYVHEEKTARGETVMIPLQGKEHATARMIAETRAKRRATLAIIGLGLHATEQKPVAFDPTSG